MKNWSDISKGNFKDLVLLVGENSAVLSDHTSRI